MNKIKHAEFIEFLKNFNEQNGRPPTTSEINAQEGILSVRQVQRSYGGLVSMRELAGLPGDLRKTPERAEKARQINTRGALLETKFYKRLSKIYGEMRVHREYSFIDDTRHRSDFLVYLSESNRILIDVFFPGDRASMGGCVGSKRRKYEEHTDQVSVKDIYFVNLNPNLDVESYSFKKEMPWAKVVNEDTFWKLLPTLN